MRKTTLCRLAFILALALASSANADGIADWLNAIQTSNPGYVKTQILTPTVDDIGNYSLATGGGVTYEFIYNADVGGVSSALMGAGYAPGNVGSDPGGLKLDQCCNTGKFGVTLFGAYDVNFATDSIFGVDTQAVFVMNGTGAELYVNGVLADTVNSSFLISGSVGIGQAYDNSTGGFDQLNGAILGVAVYDSALTAATIRNHYNAFVVPEPSALILVSSGLGGLAMIRRARRLENER
ncbi:LamG domain-containing protein [Aeoliella sp. ICT_H6.2]|uniref:LamG domain-containing protein n=1 Tax=Aeoliella straminimaris TaxID=2954799 RepID=A0A9X2JHU5_9BACT|nr:LamG-like jellyroll fold domain-containing protein [Aeoliella straminimaris]MCO6046181.1 LamG domain-containing protein [Aeoliella straminimaris]